MIEACLKYPRKQLLHEWFTLIQNRLGVIQNRYTLWPMWGYVKHVYQFVQIKPMKWCHVLMYPHISPGSFWYCPEFPAFPVSFWCCMFIQSPFDVCLDPCTTLSTIPIMLSTEKPCAVYYVMLLCTCVQVVLCSDRH